MFNVLKVITLSVLTYIIVRWVIKIEEFRFLQPCITFLLFSNFILVDIQTEYFYKQFKLMNSKWNAVTELNENTSLFYQLIDRLNLNWKTKKHRHTNIHVYRYTSAISELQTVENIYFNYAFITKVLVLQIIPQILFTFNDIRLCIKHFFSYLGHYTSQTFHQSRIIILNCSIIVRYQLQKA